MANFYCDHGAYGAANRLGLDVPAWGVPQEGDGTTKDAATASGVVSVDLTSITSNASTVSIYGSTAISITAGQSGATLAATIAGLINASSLATANAGAPGYPQVRNLVYARNTGATLEIMCRIGSGSLNVLGVVWGGTWTAGPPANLTFSGGVGGCWGWFFNNAAIGAASSIAVATYGVWLFKPYSIGQGADDRIYVRTGGGASKTIAYTTSGSVTVTTTNVSTNHLVFDANTIWTGDSAVGQLLIDWTHTGTILIINIAANTVAKVMWRALRVGGFKFKFTNTAVSGGSVSVFDSIGSSSNVVLFDKIEVEDATDNIVRGFSIIQMSASGTASSTIITRCKLSRTAMQASILPIITLLDYQEHGYLGIMDNEYSYALTGGSNPGPLVAVLNQSASYNLRVDLLHNTFTGYGPGFDLYSGTFYPTHQTATAAINIVVEGNSGVKMPSAYFGMATALNTNLAIPDIHSIMYSDLDGGFRAEHVRGVTEFVPDGSFPLLNSTLFDGVTGWSLRHMWLPLSSDISRPGATSSIKTIVQSAGYTTIKMEMFIKTALVFDNESGYVRMTYVDGSSVRQSVLVPFTSITASTAIWTNTASFPTLSAHKIELTVPSIKAGTEVWCQMFFTSDPSTSTSEAVYVDPMLVIS